MNETTAWTEYVRALIEGGSAAAFSERTGISTSTVSRWLSGEYEPKPKQAVQVARAYGLSPIAALVAAEYLSEDEVELPASQPRLLRLLDFTELELSMEIVRRIASRTDDSELLESPLDSSHPAVQALEEQGFEDDIPPLTDDEIAEREAVSDGMIVGNIAIMRTADAAKNAGRNAPSAKPDR